VNLSSRDFRGEIKVRPGKKCRTRRGGVLSWGAQTEHPPSRGGRRQIAGQNEQRHPDYYKEGRLGRSEGNKEKKDRVKKESFCAERSGETKTDKGL